ncbi:PA2169 family four-helix-bundle protein [Gelidibacter sp.]|uniref:ferritin-like domain-containing protein n=1 Tax=Gelidibacter sp. TaxID=2018083 RepID=UPI003263D713
MKTTLEKAREKTNRDTVNVLQIIITKNYDAQKGYRKAMVDVKNPELKTFLQQQARQRSNFLTEIDQEIRSLNEIPKENGSRTGTLHRAWIDVKNFVAGNNDETVIEEVIRGEKAKINEYRDVLKRNTLAPQIISMLQSQLNGIKNTLKQVKTLDLEVSLN